MWKLIDAPSPRGDLIGPRSYCPHCAHPIARRHLIPIVSYFILGGECAHCSARISARYPIVEALGAGLGVLALGLWGVSFAALFAAVFCWILLALAVIDLETGYLPDAMTLPLAVIGLAVNAGGMFTPFSDAAIGAIVGYGAFRLIGAAFERLRGMEGLGQGDAKLLLAVGAWLGWAALAPVVLIASLAGLCAIGVARLRGAKIESHTAIAFGPALSFGAASYFLITGLIPNVL